MFTWPFWLTLVLAAGEWLAVWRGWRRVRRVTKPGTLLALLAWFTLVGAWRGPLVWFGVGLLFSLLGDVILLLPARFFLGGLAAFLTAHLAYIAGFNCSPLPLRWEAALAALACIAVAAAGGRLLRRGVHRYSRSRRLLHAVSVYIVVISLMALSAVLTLFKPEWPLAAAVLCSVGALLFWVSDALLGLTRFIHAYRYAPLGVMVTYHLGQIAITTGVLVAFRPG